MLRLAAAPTFTMSSGLSFRAKELASINNMLEAEYQKRLHYDDLPLPEEGQSRSWIAEVHVPYLTQKLASLDQASPEAASVSAAIKYQKAVLFYLQCSRQ